MPLTNFHSYDIFYEGKNEISLTFLYYCAYCNRMCGIKKHENKCNGVQIIFEINKQNQSKALPFSTNSVSNSIHLIWDDDRVHSKREKVNSNYTEDLDALWKTKHTRAMLKSLEFIPKPNRFTRQCKAEQTHLYNSRKSTTMT